MSLLTPPADFASVKLEIATVDREIVLSRICGVGFPDPLGFGKAPSRFSDPRPLPDDERFGVLYLGSSLKVCFLETLLRDKRDGLVSVLPMAESELEARLHVESEGVDSLSLVDLTGDARVRMGVPSDVCGASDQTAARLWSQAFYEHPAGVDGIRYASRLNDAVNFALYDRAVCKIRLRSANPLIDAAALGDILDDFKVGLV